MAVASTPSYSAIGFVPKTTLSFQDDSATSSASVVSGNWHGRVSAGYAFYNQTHLSYENVISHTWDGDGGWSLHAALGYQFDERWSAELEFGYTSLDHKTLNASLGADTFRADGSLDYWTVLVGPRFTIELADRFDWYVSGLIGAAFGRGNADYSAVISGVAYSGSGARSATAFGYAVRTGIEFELSPRIYGSVGFRLDGSSDFSFDVGLPSDLKARSLSMGIEGNITFEF
jgi:opacity protein-like surface antigen